MASQQAQPIPLTFYFRVDRMGPNPLLESNYFPSGQWMPPQPLGSNLLLQIGIWFVFENGVVRALGSEEQPGTHRFRESSVYYSDDRIWIYPANATRNQVGEVDPPLNLRLTPQPAAPGDHVPLSELVEPYESWTQLSFRHYPTSASSFALTHGQATLRYRRWNQFWVDEVLPRAYHPPPENSSYNGACRLVGNLDIQIALIALSMHPSRLNQGLPQSVQQYGSFPRNRGEGWIHQRGLVVKINYQQIPPPLRARDQRHRSLSPSTWRDIEKEKLGRFENGTLPGYNAFFS